MGLANKAGASQFRTRCVHDDGDADEAEQRSGDVVPVRSEAVQGHAPRERAGDKDPPVGGQDAPEIGVRLQGGYEPVQTECDDAGADPRPAAVLAHALDDGRAAVLHRDPERTAAGLDDFAPGDGQAWLDLFEQWQRMRDPLLDALFTPFPPVRAGARLLAVGVSPATGPQARVVDKPRYHRMRERYGDLSPGAGMFGMHVHVGVPDPETGVQVLNHLRPWLPIFQAAAANSPLSNGRDTGYASWRSMLWERWPTTGPAPYLRDHEHYLTLIKDLEASGAAA